MQSAKANAQGVNLVNGVERNGSKDYVVEEKVYAQAGVLRCSVLNHFVVFSTRNSLESSG
jgi:hypothetical protein